MRIINIIVAYFLFFIAPKRLIHKSLPGTLLQLDTRLPVDVSYEIALNLYDLYSNNKKINKLMKRGGINENMEMMLDLIQYEAFYIRDLLSEKYCHISHDQHKNTIKILRKYSINMPNYRE